MVGKIKNKTVGAAIKNLLEAKNVFLFLSVDDNSGHKKTKGVNKNVVAAITHDEIRWLESKVKIIEQELINLLTNLLWI